MKLIFTILLGFLIVHANQFTQKETIISNVTKHSAVIPLGSLKVGQSGVIIHNFGQGNPP